MDEDITVATDAGADSPESQPAVVEGATTTPEPEQSADAVSPESQPAVVEGEEATVTDEPVKKTLEERVEELASKKIAEAEARINARLQTEFTVAALTNWPSVSIRSLGLSPPP